MHFISGSTYGNLCIFHVIVFAGDASIIWEGHKAGRVIGYSHVEKLYNLEVLPSTGFSVVMFPTKIYRGSAGWTRAVAIVDRA